MVADEISFIFLWRTQIFSSIFTFHLSLFYVLTSQRQIYSKHACIKGQSWSMNCFSLGCKKMSAEIVSKLLETFEAIRWDTKCMIVGSY